MLLGRKNFRRTGDLKLANIGSINYRERGIENCLEFATKLGQNGVQGGTSSVCSCGIFAFALNGKSISRKYSARHSRRIWGLVQKKRSEDTRNEGMESSASQLETLHHAAIWSSLPMKCLAFPLVREMHRVYLHNALQGVRFHEVQ